MHTLNPKPSKPLNVTTAGGRGRSAASPAVVPPTRGRAACAGQPPHVRRWGESRCTAGG